MAAAVAARRVCHALELPQAVQAAATQAFGDEGLARTTADAEDFLVQACRRLMEGRQSAVGEEELERALAEVLRSVWRDPDWRRARASAGKPASDAADCPVREILQRARCALSYGDPASNRKYFQNFGRMNMQATMLQDETRTGTYKRAILQNRPDFEGKVVMDVGSGTGILAFFAIQARGLAGRLGSSLTC
jgi:hypothetical protein